MSKPRSYRELQLCLSPGRGHFWARGIWVCSGTLRRYFSLPRNTPTIWVCVAGAGERPNSNAYEIAHVDEDSSSILGHLSSGRLVCISLYREFARWLAKENVGWIWVEIEE